MVYHVLTRALGIQPLSQHDVICRDSPPAMGGWMGGGHVKLLKQK